VTGLSMSDQGAFVVVADLLAHWWSRPTVAEVDCWLGAAEIEADVRRQLAGDAAGSSPGEVALTYRGDEVPALLTEYERLFVGPAKVPCPPYESYWRDDVPIDLWHSLMGPCTADLRRLYRELRIDVDPAAGELPDHVAVEFEALAYALTRDDGDEGERVAASLIREHLSVWLPKLCHSVAKEARHPFYHDLADITVNWLEHIQRYLATEAEAPPVSP
jgi:TorA maturation chaperone TorD